jgi:hypothetical protein
MSLTEDASASWILGCFTYWSVSRDDGFIREQWPRLLKSYQRTATAWAHVTSIQQAAVLAAAVETVPALAQVAGDDEVAAEASRRFERMSSAFDQQYWLERLGIYAAGTAALPGQEPEAQTRQSAELRESLTIWPATAMAFGLLEDARSNRMLREIASGALSADWGIRALSSYDRHYDALDPARGAVRPDLTASASIAHYRYHRAWSGYDLLRDLADASFDFATGHVPATLSGAFYQLADGSEPTAFSAGTPLVPALLGGLLGLHVDAPNRAISVEPHLPPFWERMSMGPIEAGRDRIHMEIRREAGRYTLTLRRAGSGPTLFVRLAPALPLGARVARVRVNDRDVPVQVEESAHDVHAVVEVQLLTDAEVEIEFQGGMEVVAPETDHRLGAASSGLRVLDFRKEGSDFIALVEGAPAGSHALTLRSDLRVRTVSGAELVQQLGDRVVLRVRFGAAVTPVARREIRIPT